MSSPFKTKEFKNLFNEWNKKLEESGFEDAEDFNKPIPLLKEWHNFRFKRPKVHFGSNNRAEYYRLAQQLSHTFKFENKMHELVWKLHSQGVSVRDIAEEISEKKYKKTTIALIIKNIRRSI